MRVLYSQWNMTNYKLTSRALVWKRTSNSYNISRFWICSIKVDKCLRTYYKLSWKYVNTAKIISKVTITLSLINSNKDFDFVGWVIKTPCAFYFRSVKFHYVKETNDINSLLTLVKVVLASQHKRQPSKSLSRFIWWHLKTPTRTWKCTRCNMQMSSLIHIRLAFQKFLQTRQTSRSNRKLCKKGFWLWLSIV